MTYDTTDWYDEKINFILTLLFSRGRSPNKAPEVKQAIQYLDELDIAATYFLFSLICEQLPHRAKMLFAGEDYEGKRQTLIEVMRHRIS